MSTGSSSQLLATQINRSSSSSILSTGSRKAWQDDDDKRPRLSSTSRQLDTAQGHTELKTKIHTYDDSDQITSLEVRNRGKRIAGTAPDTGLWPSIKRFLSGK